MEKVKISCWKNFIPNSRLFKKWFLYYLLVMFLPTLLAIIIFSSYSYSLKKETIRSNTMVIEQVKTLIDQQILNTNQFATKAALLPNIVSLINKEAPLTSSDRFAYRELSEELSAYALANSIVENIYIIDSKQKNIITTQTRIDCDTYYQAYINSAVISKNDWLDFLVNSETGLHCVQNDFEKNSSTEIAYYIAEIPLNFTYKPRIIFKLNMGSLLNGITNTYEEEGSIFYILCQNQQSLSIPSNNNLFNAQDYEQLQTPSETMEINDNQYLVVSSLSDVTASKFISIRPYDSIMEPAERIRNISFLLILFFVFLGVILCFFISKKNYSPINTIFRTLRSDKGVTLPANISNEFYVLHSVVTTIIDQNKRLLVQINHQKSAAYYSFFHKLLTGKMDYSTSFEEQAELIGITFPSEKFEIVGVHLNDYSSFVTGQNQTADKSLAVLAIQNIFNEMFGQCGSCYYLEMGDLLLFVISFQSETENLSTNEDHLLQVVKQASEIIANQFKFHMTVVLSDLHENISGISIGYQEILEGMEYRKLYPSNAIIRYPEIHQRLILSSEEIFPSSQKEELILAIKQGNLPLVCSILDTLIGKDQQLQTKMTIQTIRRLIFDLIFTITKTIEDLDLPDYDLSEKQNILYNLLSDTSIETVRSQLETLLASVCHYTVLSPANRGEVLQQKIETYIQEHYQDPNLSNTIIATECGISEAYLSRFFKKHTGENLLDYIHKIRLARAKQLLQEGSMTITEISQNLGYGSSNTFIRIFKKYIGITPGEYRNK